MEIMPCAIVTPIDLAAKRGHGTIHAARVESIFRQNSRLRGQNNTHAQRKEHLSRELDSQTAPRENQRCQQEPLQKKIAGKERISIAILWKTIMIYTPS